MPNTSSPTPDTNLSTWSYLDLRHSLLDLSLLQERQVVTDLRAARRMSPPEPAAVPRTVLLAHGFLDDGRAVRPLAARLRAAGHDARLADIGRNVACGEVMLGRLQADLQRVARETGGPVVLVGHSRGGALSRAATVRHPDLVDGLVTLGSPTARPHDITLLLRLVKLGMRVATRVGVPGLIGECAFGVCCSAYTRDLTGPFPAAVPYWSVRGRQDGMVAAGAVEDPAAEVIDVTSSHAGLPVAPEPVAIVERALDEFPVGAKR